MKKFVLFLCFSLGSVLAQSPERVFQQSPASTDQVIDLRAGECVVIRPGMKLRIKLKMTFNAALPSGYQTFGYPTFLRSTSDDVNHGPVYLPVEQISLMPMGETGSWEYIGVVNAAARTGDYQMTEFGARADYFDTASRTRVSAPTTLSTEARQEIAAYHLCIKDGFVPDGPTSGVIQSINPPK